MHRVVILVSPELKERLKIAAKLDRRSVSNLVKHTLEGLYPIPESTEEIESK